MRERNRRGEEGMSMSMKSMSNESELEEAVSMSMVHGQDFIRRTQPQ